MGGARSVEGVGRLRREIGHLILSRPDMLSAEGFGQLAGLGPAEMERRRLRREVLAFEVGDGRIRAPMWQVGGDRSLLPALPLLFEALGDDPWSVYLFLTSPHPQFDWAAPLQTLRNGVTAPVVAAAFEQGLEAHA